MIVKNLRESRENMFLKQKDVAKILGVHSSTVSGWETGKDTIPLNSLVYYANYYSISLDYLFGLCNSTFAFKHLIINPKIIGENMKHLRITNNLSQDDVAYHLNNSQGTYSDYENGINLINTPSLFSLTLVYKNISLDDFFTKK